MATPESSTAKVLGIPEIFFLICQRLDSQTLRSSNQVSSQWHETCSALLWRELVIPKDWCYPRSTKSLQDLLWVLNRIGSKIRWLSLRLSKEARTSTVIDQDLIDQRLVDILSKLPNLQRLHIQLPQLTPATVLGLIAKQAPQLRILETEMSDWRKEPLTRLLKGCTQLRQLSGHVFTGEILQTIAEFQPSLMRLTCIHPRFDDQDLMAFVKRFPNLLQLSMPFHSFLSSKTLMGVSENCQKLDHLGLRLCMSIESQGIQAMIRVSTNLQHLDLGVTGVLDQDLELLAETCLNLKSLRLPFCGEITTRGVKSIVTSCQWLSFLDISWCPQVGLELFDESVTFGQEGQENSHRPWVCLGIQHLDIGGIHAIEPSPVQVESELLQKMYTQLGKLSALRFLGLCAHPFDLRLMDLGIKELGKLKRLEKLALREMLIPLTWDQLVCIGNLFPNLTGMRFGETDITEEPTVMMVPVSGIPSVGAEGSGGAGTTLFSLSSPSASSSSSVTSSPTTAASTVGDEGLSPPQSIIIERTRRRTKLLSGLEITWPVSDEEARRSDDELPIGGDMGYMLEGDLETDEWQ